MPWIDVNRNDIYYTEAGTGQPIVFLHGFSSCSEAWFQQFALFGNRYHVIAYDSINHGHSANSPRDEDEPDRVDELEGFLVAMNIERPVLIGNSMGAATLLRWATRHPSDAAALVASGMGVMTPDAQRTAPVREPLPEDKLYAPVGASFTPGFKDEQPLMLERYYRIRSTATRLEALRNLRQPSKKTQGERAELAERVESIKSPMLIIVGELDRLKPAAQRLSELKPEAEYHEIAGGPHNAYWEMPDKWNAPVGDFLARVD